jgi:superfamily II DNA/RNA helicase
MPDAIVRIATKYMKLPVSIEVAPSGTTASEVDQEIFIIKNEDRFEHLKKILTQYTGSVLIFVRTKHGVKTLTSKLKFQGYRATEIHSNLSLNRRRSALNDFKSKKERILVATDVASRGLDVKGIELVVNYNLPDNCEDYVHRIGRTGRAGKLGKAITFATPGEQRQIKIIERLINKSLKQTKFVQAHEEKFLANLNTRRAPFGRSSRSSSVSRGYRSFSRRR